MTDIPADDLEIVGFNGAPRVECGRDLPVARWRSRNAYFALSSNPNPVYYTEKEIEDLCDQERVTRFPEAKPVPASVIHNGKLVAVPVILWVRDAFSNEFKLIRPAGFGGESISWQQLDYKGISAWAACVCNDSAEFLLDHWGRELYQKAESIRLSTTGQWDEVKRLADLGLCAALDRGLRFDLYLLYAACELHVDRQAAKRTFECLVNQEFPEKTWDEFECSSNSIIKQTKDLSSLFEEAHQGSGRLEVAGIKSNWKDIISQIQGISFNPPSPEAEEYLIDILRSAGSIVIPGEAKQSPAMPAEELLKCLVIPTLTRWTGLKHQREIERIQKGTSSPRLSAIAAHELQRARGISTPTPIMAIVSCPAYHYEQSQSETYSTAARLKMVQRKVTENAYLKLSPIILDSGMTSLGDHPGRRTKKKSKRMKRGTLVSLRQ